MRHYPFSNARYSYNIVYALHWNYYVLQTPSALASNVQMTLYPLTENELCISIIKFRGLGSKELPK